MKQTNLIIVIALLLSTSVPAIFAQGQRPADANGQNAKVVPPFKIFDNLYYIGIDYVCSYVIKTNAGLIVVDTLYDRFTDHPAEALQQLGLNPKDVRYIVITHGHNDHFGGAKKLQDLKDVDVNLTSHPWAALILERGAMAKSRKPGDPNPFVAPADFKAFLQERLTDAETRLAALR